MKSNHIESVISQLGIDVVKSCVGELNIGNCEMHGHYLIGTTDGNGNVQLSCPTCAPGISAGNGLTATEVDHIIDMREVPTVKLPAAQIAEPFLPGACALKL